MINRSTAIPVVLSSILVAPAYAHVDCEGEIRNREIDDNVAVAVPCTLINVEVDGDIDVFAGGSLIAINVEVDRNIYANDADYVDIRNSEIGNNIRLDDMVGDASVIQDNTVGNDINVRRSRSYVEILRNFVEDDINLLDNDNLVIISDNIVEDNVDCRGNDPEPRGQNNQVAGEMRRQCENLQAPEAPEDPGDEDPGDEDPGDTGDDDSDDTADDPPPNEGSEDPPFEVNSGAGGGAATGVMWIALLGFLAIRRRQI